MMKTVASSMKSAAVLALLAAALAGAADNGFQACARCHAAQAAELDSAMAHTLMRAENCDVLKKHPRLTGEKDGYSYEIVREGERSIYTVRKGSETVSARLIWAFGEGNMAGQAYIFQWKGAWYDSRVSYYPEIRGLDVTMGFQGEQPGNIEQAAGRRLDVRLLMECFECHTTGEIKDSDLDHVTPGVLCDKCHGSSAPHLEAVRSGNAANFAMQKLGKLNTEQMANCCGRCHGDMLRLAANGETGPITVRFQAYRLAESPCYNEQDRRISCVTCHDPHQRLDARPADYDVKCQACHHAGLKKTCKVAVHDCVTCHMPKIEPPEAHHRFTDHQIRIARASAPYPE